MRDGLFSSLTIRFALPLITLAIGRFPPPLPLPPLSLLR